MFAIGKGHGARIAQKADFGHLAALAALGQRRHVQNAHRRLRGAAGDEFQRFGRVDGGQRVGAGDERGHAPRGSRGGGRTKAFAVPFTRLADFHPPVDDARRKAFAGAVDHLGIGGGLHLADRGDDAIVDHHIAARLGQRLGVDQAGVLQKQGHRIPFLRSSIME